ncbi:MAG: glutamine--fructose-6-phosphate transaminase (isomerizing) [Deltaproteobacteria bacterium]|nr:MAG: glutamine--fructose-6-phosphate transaminase (isomerizing) [Deltaproteobacteria bacterium]
MCGIVGYVGERDAVSVIMDGLKRLEYRGYDSAGIATLEKGIFASRRRVGKLVNLEKSLKDAPIGGRIGIGHTRWATHGEPNEGNAHPHGATDVVVVHNGIIENYLQLRKKLLGLGYEFASDTDTEVIPHLIDYYTKEGLTAEAAFRMALGELEGSYGVAVICSSAPDTVFAARKASPLVLGVGEGESLVASDIPALLSYTRDVIFLNDGDVAILTAKGVRVTDLEGEPLDRPVTTIQWSPAMAEKGGYKHFMLKEIFEQPRAIAETMTGKLNSIDGRVTLEGEGADEIAANLKALHIVACGTSYHASMVAKYWIEKMARMPVSVDLASEYRYRDPLIGEGTGLLLVSQSGETADTLAALEEGRAKGAPVLSICNVLGSSLSRRADATLYTHAGPEIGVASTKAFTTQLVTLYMMALFFGRARGHLSDSDVVEKMELLRRVPGAIEAALEYEDEYKKCALKIKESRSAIFLGRGLNFPIALEGALKLKEISYIHAEGYAAGEMKHGPIALVDKDLPVISILTPSVNYEKMLSNIEEVRARGGICYAVAVEGDENAEALNAGILPVPEFEEELMPIIASVPLQLLAYHVAELKGTDVDQPRNLAKAVTVE